MKTNPTAENTGWLLANLEGDPGKRKASKGAMNTWVDAYFKKIT